MCRKSRPYALLGDHANASPVDPNMTFTKLPDQIIWEAARNRPPNTVEQALLWGKTGLVNYRAFGNVVIVDRLFAAAELRLGGEDQQKVRVIRTDGGPR